MNTARMRVAEMRLKHCDEIFLVTELNRAITNQGVEDILLRQLGRNFSSLQRKQGVAIICTKSEVDCDVLFPIALLRNLLTHVGSGTNRRNSECGPSYK